MNPLYFKSDALERFLGVGRRPLSCVICACEDYDRDTLFEYPNKSDEWWCACCFQNYYNLEWNHDTKRWRKIRCECHNEIEIYDDDEGMWVCPLRGEEE